jgi:hypothetical protein
VTLDVRIFESKVYQALSYPQIPFVVNYSRESGRNNPFLPIGVDTGKAPTVQTQVDVNPATAPSQATTTPPTSPAKAPTQTGTPTPKKF